MSGHVVRSQFKKAYEQSEVLSTLRKVAIVKQGNPREGPLILEKLLKIKPIRSNIPTCLSAPLNRNQLHSTMRCSSTRTLRKGPTFIAANKLSSSIRRLVRVLSNGPLQGLGADVKVRKLPSRKVENVENRFHRRKRSVFSDQFSSLRLQSRWYD